MLTGESIARIETDLGVNSTKTRDLVQWLRSNGWTCPDRLVRYTNMTLLKQPSIFKLRVRAPLGSPREFTSMWHWVVMLPTGTFFDPARMSGLTLGRLTSYLPVGRA